jgi:hypothetical protein
MEDGRYEVVWPLGPKERPTLDFPQRLDDLSGKVIAELWDWMWEGDRVFPALEKELERRYPGVRFVPYTVFGDIHGGDEHAVVEALPDLLREHGVDAVVAGVGH